MLFGKLLNKAALAGMMAVVSAPVLADVGKGGEIYQRHCTQCHESEGGDWRSRESRAFAKYVLRTPVRDLTRRIEQGGKLCPAYLVLLSEEDIDNVVDYIRVLR